MAVVAGHELGLDLISEGLGAGYGIGVYGFYSASDGFEYDEGYAAGYAAARSGSPTVSDLEPANGEPLYASTPISFSLTDVDDWVTIIPMIILNPYGTPEPVSRGVEDVDFAFEALYSSSTRVAISGGYRYTLRRRGGWPAAPRLQIWATDRSGNVWIGP